MKIESERQEIIKAAAKLSSMKVQAHIDRVKRDYLRLIGRMGEPSIKIGVKNG